MDIAVATPLDDVVAAVAVLLDPAGPGEPWTVDEIARALPSLADGPNALPVEASVARWLDAAARGKLPADD